MKVQIRDHVRHQLEWGAAAQGAKFDREITLPQTYTFRALYFGNGPDDPEVELMRVMVELLQDACIRVGAKRGLNHGRLRLCATKWFAYQRSDPADLARFLAIRSPGANTPEQPLSKPPGRCPGSEPTNVPSRSKPDSVLRVAYKCRFKGPVLIKAAFNRLPVVPPAHSDPDHDYAAAGRDKSDAVFIERDDAGPYLPEASIRGVLRSQAGWIVESLKAQKATNAAELEDAFRILFGFAKQESSEGRAELLEIGGGELNGCPRYVFLDHVAIDRIVSSAVDEKKFDTCGLESPVFDCTAAVTFRKDEMNHLTLFLYLLRDLIEGHIRAGHGTTRGFGTIGKVDLTGVALDLADDIADDISYASAAASVTPWYHRRRLHFHQPDWQHLKDVAMKLALAKERTS